MHTIGRLCLAHTPKEKAVAEQLAEPEGKLPDSTLAHRLCQKADCQHEIRPPDKWYRVSQLVQEVQRA
jgi:hypothetical protein